MKVNSQEWWENEFKNNWKVGIDGRLQTAYYCSLVLAYLHENILNEVQTAHNILDFGCALGQSTNMIYSINKKVLGYDFSIEATKEARASFPYIGFTNVFPKNDIFDITYISNVLEHFEDPFEILNDIKKITKKFIIVLVPYEQQPHAVHPHRFYDNYFDKNKLDGFFQIYQAIIQTYNKTLDGGKQILYVLEKLEH